MKRILKITLVLSTLLGLFSCSKYGSTYDIPEGNPCISFPAEDLKIQLNDAATVTTVLVDGQERKAFTAELWRGNTEGSATINVDIDMDDETAEIFKVGKECFEFANGENKACIEFTYDPDEIEKGKDYSIGISIAEESAEFVSPSGIYATDITVSDPLTLVEVGTVVIFEDFWFGEDIEATLYKAEEIEGYYVIKDALAEGFDIAFTYDGENITFPEPLILLCDEEYGWYTISMVNIIASLEGNVITAAGDSYLIDYDEYDAPITMTITLPEDWNK